MPSPANTEPSNHGGCDNSSEFESCPGYNALKPTTTELRAAKKTKQKPSDTKATGILGKLVTKQTYFKKPARLVIPAPTSKDQRWFIKFWPYDEQKNRHRLKKVYELPQADTKSQRIALCRAACRELDNALRADKVFSVESPALEPPKYPVHTIITRYFNTLGYLRPRSQTAIKQSVGKFLKFLQAENLQNHCITSLGPEIALRYRDSLLASGIANRSVNNDVNFAKRLFFYFKERNPLAMEYNPFMSLKKLKPGIGKNLAYSSFQVKEQMDLLSQYPDMALVVKFMYYTLLRTNELANLQVQNINQFQDCQIYLPAHISKNGQERHVNIPPPLMALIYSLKLLEYPPEYYLFSLKKTSISSRRRVFTPGKTPTPSVRIGERYRRWILDKLNYSKDYTLYSWKHTGVVNAHRVGVSDADIMQQTGHLDYGSFKVYMKSLGIFAKGQYAEKIPEI